jgi:hypothetical protein
MDAVIALTGVVSALAAAGAVFFAWQTVQETRALRREDRLARLPERIAELGRMGLSIGSYDPHYTIERERLATMLAPLADPLPNCHLLAAGEEFADPAMLGDRRERVGEVTRAALSELAVLMRSEG